MKKMINFLFNILTAALILLSCKDSGSEPVTDPVVPDPVLPKISIVIDKTDKYQTIDGFGFFGAADVWWSSPAAMWDDAWGEKVISDLGISIWRNEVFPPSMPGVPQDADWAKQKPVVLGLKAKADKYKVDLKFIATVWSPPADLKWPCNMSWAGDANATRQAGAVSTKNGGTLNPNKYSVYADWLKSNLQMYKDAGVDMYALSLQNELMFKQTFNSCTYTISWYNDLLVNVVPKIKAGFPNIKIYGAENMLDMEGKDENWQWFYHSGVKANPEAASNLDILAVHGYSDGVAASSGSALAKMWTNHKEHFSLPMNKKAWMTETSGYVDTWEKSGDKPGALNLAMDIHSGLFYGNMSAWVWWQGSQSNIDEFALMSGTTPSKKYFVSKHFYRYIRPGAVRVKSISEDPEFFVTAYENTAKESQAIVIINAGNTDKALSLKGVGLAATYKMYRTNSSSENCKYIKDISSGEANSFAVPAKTIVTLTAGNESL